ncbi:MAG TPA: MBOAT family O-acyltransferase [Chloroflexota bacterium]|nr:MBOAT family O-acyltransferase [Chloroflexota bacterium]HUM67934.1 MBOAT family O-acyltransferase [Chloroflexota bacterium]
MVAKHVHKKGQGRRGLLWTAVGSNLLTLGLFRLSNFFVPDLQELLNSLGIVSELGVLQILLPVGLSFYILENISYQIDVYRGQMEPTDNFVDYAVYQAYFPKLLAGPIERASHFLPKLAQPRVVNNERLARSFTLVAVGIFRKLIIADTLTQMIPREVFETPANFGAMELWGWLFVFGFALYNDFAGYTSLVRGVSGFFGIELSPNFHQPYFSRNFGEFWNSWHITLSHWLRDYIYFPTLRSLLRRNRSRTHALNVVVPPLVTMLISGLWHGFSLHMMVWGGLHGGYQIGERILSLRGPVVAPGQRPRWRQLLAMGVVFLLVMWAWVPFRMEMPVAIEFWKQLLSFGEFSLPYRRLAVAVSYILVSVGIDFVQHHYHDEVVFLRWPRLAQAFLLATVIFLVIIVSVGTVTKPFVYQGF